jgi:hypothetical protein
VSLQILGVTIVGSASLVITQPSGAAGSAA